MYWQRQDTGEVEYTYTVANGKLLAAVDKANRKTTYDYTEQNASMIYCQTKAGDLPKEFTYVNLSRMTYPTGAATESRSVEVPELPPIRKKSGDDKKTLPPKKKKPLI